MTLSRDSSLLRSRRPLVATFSLLVAMTMIGCADDEDVTAGAEDSGGDSGAAGASAGGSTAKGGGSAKGGASGKGGSGGASGKGGTAGASGKGGGGVAGNGGSHAGAGGAAAGGHAAAGHDAGGQNGGGHNGGGGSSAAGAGGNSSIGGAAATGGGGATSAGGGTGAGGLVGAGGAGAAGGGIGAGGLVGAGGDTGAGGLVGAGGDTGAGGLVGAGGDTGAGGFVGAGGDTGAGGLIGAGGDTGAGGLIGAGGDIGAGGLVGVGGDSAGGVGGIAIGGAGGSVGGGAALGPPAVFLGASGNYVILAESEITNVATSAIVGDMGISPMAASFITGFPDMTKAGTFWTSVQVTGKIYAADNDPPTPDALIVAINDMGTAYTDAAGRPTPDFLDLGMAGNIGGLVLPPGLYKWNSTVTIPLDVTIVGGADDVWIFQISGDLTVSPGMKTTVAGGARPKNIFWQVAGQVDLGTTSHAEGVILSKTLIAMDTGASINGRLLAQTAVTLQQNAVTTP